MKLKCTRTKGESITMGDGEVKLIADGLTRIIGYGKTIPLIQGYIIDFGDIKPPANFKEFGLEILDEKKEVKNGLSND